MKTFTIVPVLLTVLLSACGGGGSSDSTPKTICTDVVNQWLEDDKTDSDFLLYWKPLPIDDYTVTVSDGITRVLVYETRDESLQSYVWFKAEDNARECDISWDFYPQ